MKKFSGYKAAVIVKPGEIKCYNVIDLDTNNLEPIDKQYVERHMPDWKGEKYGVSLFKWNKKHFYLEREYYSNDSVEAEVIEEEYQDIQQRNLQLPDKYSQIKEISNLLSSANVAAYAEGDLNTDKREDLVLVYRDTAVIKTWMDALLVDDCHLVIFEAIGRNEYKNRYKYNFSSRMLDIGKLEIEDINGDGFKDVVLRVLTWGASGWSEIVEVFSRINNK